MLHSITAFHTYILHKIFPYSLYACSQPLSIREDTHTQMVCTGHHSHMSTPARSSAKMTHWDNLHQYMQPSNTCKLTRQHNIATLD